MNDESKKELGVRMRVVVQQVASGAPSAGKLGLSSATPSGEAVRALLAMGSQPKMGIATLDVSDAFLHSRLPRGERVLVRLPPDVSWSPTEYAPVFADLSRALNGLRSASRAWLDMVCEEATAHNLQVCPTESTVFKGIFNDGEISVFMALICYVDDLLVVSPDPRAPQCVQKMLRRKVEKVKVTGCIPPQSVGVLHFLGREISRTEDLILRVRVPTPYLQELTQDLSATDTPPNLDALGEPMSYEDSAALSEKKANKYRSDLGRLAWWTQSRPDFLRYTSLLSTGQQKPTVAHERALHKVLRFAKSCLHLFQEFVWDTSVGVRAFCDASWSARSVNGFVVCWHGCVIKRASRQQTSKSLSSCEADLIAMTVAAQETFSLCKLFQFLETDANRSFRNIQEFLDRDVEALDDTVTFELITDSMAAYQVLIGDGFSRRVRHLGIGVAFLQSLSSFGILVPKWVSTEEQLADFLTKCLSREKFERFRDMLGIRVSSPPEHWQVEPVKPGNQKPKTEPLSSLFAFHHPVREIIHDMQEFDPQILILELCTEDGFRPLRKRTVLGFRCYVVQSTERKFRLPESVSFFNQLVKEASCRFQD